MKGFKKILFPVDFSEVSPMIVPWVITMVDKFKSELHLIFVVRSLLPLTSFDVTETSIISFEGEILKAGEKSMDEFVKKHFKKYPACKAHVLTGDPAEEILNYVNNENIDLVIMGTHGRKGLDRVLFGSVAAHVIKESSAPVMSINPYRLSLDKNKRHDNQED
ncbi:MAG: universal stress protein [Deltaproteobacteria bacterium]|nr:universal stress protein [Deltaproteobacteria bacterium]